MPVELFYTSAPRGLYSKGPGFCTIAHTDGMSSDLVHALESLSTTTRVYEPGDPRWPRNPPAFSHWVVKVGATTHSVLSRNYPIVDDDGRTAVFAHLVAIPLAERPRAGPAWLARQAGFLEERFEGEPRKLPAGSKTIGSGSSAPRVCEAWRAATGDAGWAGALAERIVLNATEPSYVVYEAGADVLALIDEAMALLPEDMRWRVTFTTLFSEAPRSSTCIWRFCEASTPAARKALSPGAAQFVIDLTKPTGEARATAYVQKARTGRESGEALRGDRVEAPLRSARQAAARGAPASAASDPPLALLELDDADDADEAPSRPRLEPAPRARSGPARGQAFWAVAIAWPVIVAAGAWLLLHEQGGSAPDPASAAGEVGRLRADVKRREDELRSKEQKLLLAYGRLEESEKRVKALEDEEAALKRATAASPPAPLATPGAPAPTIAARPDPVIARPSPAVTPTSATAQAAERARSPAAMAEWSFTLIPRFQPGASTPATALPPRVPGAVHAHILLPAIDPLKPFAVVPAGDALEIVRKPYGEEEHVTVASVGVTGDGVVTWRWESVDPVQVEEFAATLERLARYCVVRVDGPRGPLATRQLIEPLKITLRRDLVSGTSVDADWPEYDLAVVAAPAGWRCTPEVVPRRGPSLTVTATAECGGSFSIDVIRSKTGGSIIASTNLATVRRDAKAEQDGLPKTIDQCAEDIRVASAAAESIEKDLAPRKAKLDDKNKAVDDHKAVRDRASDSLADVKNRIAAADPTARSVEEKRKVNKWRQDQTGLESDLAAAEDVLSRYKADRDQYKLAEFDPIQSNLDEARGKVAVAQARHDEALKRRKALQSQLDGFDKLPDLDVRVVARGSGAILANVHFTR